MNSTIDTLKNALDVHNNHLRLFAINKNRVLTGPKIVLLYITDVCNLKCLHCWYHSPLDKKKKLCGELKFEKIRQVFDDCRTLGVREIHISGRGEPTLHSRFHEIVQYAARNKFKMHLFTNATFPHDWIKCITLFDVLNIDLSAVTEEQYSVLQSAGSTGHFKIVLGNLRLLAGLKKHGKKTPHLKLVYVLNARNYTEIPQVFELAERMKIDEVFIKNIDTRRFHASLQLTPSIVSKAECIIKKMAHKKFFIKRKSNLKHNFLARGVYLDELFMKPTRPKACYMTWYYTFISTSGQITPCCQMQDSHIMGNIYRDPFKEVWRSKQFQRLRLWGSRSLFDNTIDVCRYCCHYQDNNAIQQQLQQLGLAS